MVRDRKPGAAGIPGGVGEGLSEALRTRLAAELAARRREIASALRRRDWDALAMEAHRLAGAAAYCGATRLGDGALALERAARGGRPATIRRRWQGLEALAAAWSAHHDGGRSGG